MKLASVTVNGDQATALCPVPEPHIATSSQVPQTRQELVKQDGKWYLNFANGKSRSPGNSGNTGSGYTGNTGNPPPCWATPEGLCSAGAAAGSNDIASGLDASTLCRDYTTYVIKGTKGKTNINSDTVVRAS